MNFFMLQNQRNYCSQLEFYKHLFYLFLISVLFIMILKKNNIKYCCVKKLWSIILFKYISNKKNMAVYIVYMDLVLWPVDAIC